MIPSNAALGEDVLGQTPRPVSDAATDEFSICPLAPVPDSAVSAVLFESSGPTPGPFGAEDGPAVGDTVLGFELVCELGRGAFARVFLARETALSDRPVVLKLSHRPTGEAERLARLRHPNVVPVYSVHRHGALQVICMPYLGRTTLADLLLAHRLGRAGVREADPGPPNPVRDPGPVLRVLAGLAAGLAHAHAHGILHLDIKPSNVLVTDAGEPLLFDFNLSLDGTRGDRDHIGGTKPYMSAEQMLDLVGRASARVDARSDLYSLGVTAFELLTGELPFPAAADQSTEAFIAARRAAPPPLRERNPGVPPAVEALVHKLLAPDPRDRYQTAEQLREDIGRHLADLPLRYGANPSWRERFGKWRRRNPWLPARLASAGALGLALGLGALAYARTDSAARTAAAGRAREARAALEAVRLDLLLTDPAANARGRRLGAEALAAYGLPGPTNWRERPVARRLTDEDRAATGYDLGELMALMAHAHWREAEGRPDAEKRAAAQVAWELNAAARGCFAPGAVPFLDRQAAELAPHAGRAFDPPAPCGCAAVAARAQFLDALEELTRGRYGTAAEHLDDVVVAQPTNGAAQFALAYCRQQRGENQVALERYKVAAALLPTDPRPAFHRGEIFALLKRPDRAEAEYTAALDRDPRHADALFFRALARYRQAGAPAARLAGAEADLTAALACGARPLCVLFLRADVRELAGDTAGARADRAAARALEPLTEADFLARGYGRLRSDPKGALADFRAAAERNPRSQRALYQEAYLLGERFDDAPGALAVATRIVDLFPEFATGRAGRALLLARTGRRAEAHTEIERARLLSSDAEITFLAACVFARTAAAEPRDRAVALDLLRRAVRDGFWDAARLAADADLNALGDDAELRAIRDSVSRLAR